MPDPIFMFKANVAEGGYHWSTPAEGKPLPRPRPGEEALRTDFRRRREALPVLTDGIPLHDSAPDRFARTYEPLTERTRTDSADYSALFKTFAETSPDGDGVLAFANEYGLLGVEPALVEVPMGDRVDVATWADGETLTAWHAEIAAMRDVLMLSKFVERKDQTRIDEFFRADRQRVALIAPHHDRFQPGDAIRPAQYYILRAIDERLHDHVSTRPLLNLADTSTKLYLVPDSLLAALWLQAAQAIYEKRKIRRCAHCRRWFEVSPQTNRTNRRYCSESHKTLAYRKRKERARALNRKGVPVPEIARRLDTTAAQVRAWLKTTRQS